MSPGMSVEGRSKFDFSKKKVAFGTYILAYTCTTHSMKKKATSAHAFRIPNSTGEYYIMSLYMGKRIHSYQREELYIAEYVIERVETLAEGKNQQITHKKYPHFEWEPKIPILYKLDEELGGGYLIVKNINNPESIQEEAQENNEIEEYLVEEEQHIFNKEEGLKLVPDINISSKDENHIRETNKEEEEHVINKENNSSLTCFILLGK